MIKPNFLYNLTCRLEHPTSTTSGANQFNAFTSGTSGELIKCRIRTKSDKEKLDKAKKTVIGDLILMTDPSYSINEQDRIYYGTATYEVVGKNPNQFMDVYITYGLMEIR